MNSRNNILKDSSFKIVCPIFEQIPISIVLIIWIGFAIYKFKINPTFFSFSIVSALFIILQQHQNIVLIKDQKLVYYKKRVLPFISRTKIYEIKDISELEYAKGGFSISGVTLDLISYKSGFLGREKPKLIFKYSNKLIQLETTNNKEENNRLIELILSIKSRSEIKTE